MVHVLHALTCGGDRHASAARTASFDLRRWPSFALLKSSQQEIFYRVACVEVKALMWLQ